MRCNYDCQGCYAGSYERKDDMKPEVFDRVLSEAGCVFGFSSLVTRHNLDTICSEEWVDLLIDKGALYGWHFIYMPVGDNPDMNLMPTPGQRNKLRIAMRNFRLTKPILPVDFWNDGPLTSGCIAGGRRYFHINHRG